MKRRDFLKFLMFSPVILRTGAWAEGQPELVVASGGGPEGLVRRAVEALGGMGKFVKRGDRVLVKPNMAWDRGPQYAANTNPRVVAEVVRLCLEAGAREVLVLDNSCEDQRRVYKRSGIAEAAQAAGAKVPFVDPRRFRKVRIGGKVLKEWEVYREALEVDRIVNVPVLKHHSLARLTMGMKNLMGLIGGRRAQLHWQLGEALADLAAFFRPQLVVLDATKVLTKGGPQGGNLKFVKAMGMVVVGSDQVAVDAMGARLFGLEPEEISYVAAAHRRGLGEMDLRKLRIKRVRCEGA
ncbi:MAG: cytoplasmic protein [Deltaproteobacteria bacterium]|nr:MAG: cytoplasmic protein [Deltaproteobacteria bacterium]